MELQPVGMLFLVVSLPIALVDLRFLRVPDMLSLGGLLLALSLAALVSPDELPGRVVASALAFGSFFVLRWASGNKLGMGDVKYAAFMGATLGFEGSFMAVLVASLLGLLIAIPLLAFRRLKIHDRLPFAPFLAAGGVAWLLWGGTLARALHAGGLS